MVRKTNPALYPHEAHAQQLLKSALWARGLTYRQLAELLTENGLPITKAGLNNKVSRGRFSAGFLLMCLALVGPNISSRF